MFDLDLQLTVVFKQIAGWKYNSLQTESSKMKRVLKHVNELRLILWCKLHKDYRQEYLHRDFHTLILQRIDYFIFKNVHKISVK